MSNQSNIVVTSRTFSGIPALTDELYKYFVNVKFNNKQKLTGDELVDFIGDAKGIIVGLEHVDGQLLDKCPNLEIVVKYGVGLDNIDTEACKQRNIHIGWTGGINRLSAAEMTIGFMLALSRNLFKTSLELKKGVWNKNGGSQLSGRTIGIIGVGNIGKEVIRLLKPFNCKIMVNDIIDQGDYYRSEGLIEASKEDIFTQADIISLHVPLTDDTRCMMNIETIKLMRSDAYLINTARGPLIEFSALKEALRTNKISGAAIDVYDEEPPMDKELISLDNIICTPHIGGNSKEAVIALGMSAVEHLKQYFFK